MKKIRVLLMVLFAVLFITACGNQGTEEAPPAEEGSTTKENITTEESNEGKPEGTPVETAAPETDYEPAFPEQTRVNAVKTEFDYQTSKIAEGLNSPWGIAVLPDGSFAITEKGGSLRVMSPEGNLSGVIAGFPEVDSRGQGGLLDVKAAPDFAESRMLYFTFSEPSEEGNLTAVAKGRLSDNNTAVENFTVIYRAMPYYESEGHFGSRIALDPEGNLFISTGDRMDSANRRKVQEFDNGHGKILHITPDGNAAGESPIENEEANPEIYSYGHRNVQGLDIHPETGELWASEMGPEGGDELNLILPGRNYGWPLVSYGVEYGGQPVGEGITEMENTEQPVYYWDPVLAPSGMTFYSSDEIPEWKNNLFIGGLRSQHIARIVLEDNRVVGEERFLENEGERFRDVEMGQDGALYSITDNGNVYRIGK